MFKCMRYIGRLVQDFRLNGEVQEWNRLVYSSSYQRFFIRCVVVKRSLCFFTDTTPNKISVGEMSSPLSEK